MRGIEARRARHAAARPGRVPRRRLMALEVDVLTLFPPMVEGPLGESIPRAPITFDTGQLCSDGVA